MVVTEMRVTERKIEFAFAVIKAAGRGDSQRRFNIHKRDKSKHEMQPSLRKAGDCFIAEQTSGWG